VIKLTSYCSESALSNLTLFFIWYYIVCSWKLQYLKSEFKGQLPQAFLDHENATSITQAHFNDLNKEETSRYVNILCGCKTLLLYRTKIMHYYYLFFSVQFR